MSFVDADRFFKRLSPRDHLRRVDGDWQVTSAAFRRARVPDGWVSSVDWEAQISLDEERALRDDRHPGWGIGRFTHRDAIDEDARVVHAPEQGNRAHCSVYVGPGKAQARALAKRVRVIELPADL